MTFFRTRFISRCPPALILGLATVMLGVAASTAYGQGRLSPDFPPGVRLPQELPASSRVPPQVFIDSIDVDWTEPRLRARLLIPEGSDERGPSLSAISSEQSSALVIHLSVRDPVSGELMLAAEPAESLVARPASEPFAVDDVPPVNPNAGKPSNRVHIGGLSPWTFTGEGTRGQPGWNGALAAGGASVELRWLGTVNEWILHPPASAFSDRILLSSLNPVSGKGSFFLVRNRTGRALELGALTPWIRDAVSGQHLVAVHAAGPDAEVVQGDWRLGESGGKSRAAPAGAVLVLERRQRETPEDLARHHDVQVTASSYEFAYPPSQIVSGRLWPVALRPPVWMSRKPDERSATPDWIDLELGRTSPVEELRLIYPGAAGWSSHFNPGRLRIDLRSGREVNPVHEITIHPERSVTVVRFPGTLPVRGVRVWFEDPGGFNLPAVSGLMAVQVMGFNPD